MGTLQEEIRDFLYRNNMALNDFAAYVGKHQNTVTNWLKTGKIPKSVEGLLRSKMVEYELDPRNPHSLPFNKIISSAIPIGLITSEQVDSGEKSAEGNIVQVKVKVV